MPNPEKIFIAVSNSYKQDKIMKMFSKKQKKSSIIIAVVSTVLLFLSLTFEKVVDKQTTQFAIMIKEFFITIGQNLFAISVVVTILVWIGWFIYWKIYYYNEKLESRLNIIDSNNKLFQNQNETSLQIIQNQIETENQNIENQLETNYRKLESKNREIKDLLMLQRIYLLKEKNDFLLDIDLKLSKEKDNLLEIINKFDNDQQRMYYKEIVNKFYPEPDFNNFTVL
ncbi:MAG TPA: hypothetical protein DCS19_05025 [Flavobacterium sp.]|nr:hypothetical protein [Flavobacterium sp.]